MATLVAINAIIVSDPNAEFVHTGLFDKDGNGIVKKSSLQIQPGQLFEFADGDELARLIDQEAARYPTDAELSLHQRLTKEI